MNIFELNDYRDILKFRVASLKKSNPKFTLDQLAKRTRIQKSHLSRVMNGSSHFNVEQLFIVANEFGLSESESEFLQSLLQWQRATTSAFRTKSGKIVAKIRKENTGAKSAVKASKTIQSLDAQARYYANFLLPIVHMYLCIGGYAHQPERLAHRLNLDIETLNGMIDELEQMQIIIRKPEGITVLQEAMHLPAVNALTRSHQINLRIAACSALQNDVHRKDLFFSASFSCNRAGVTSLRQRFYQFLEEAQEISKSTSGELDVVHLNFDLFSHKG